MLINNEQHEFEEEVRRVARELWPSAMGGGAVMVDGRERDGVFVSEECVHLVECTVSRAKDKAKEDVFKLNGLIPKMRRTFPGKAVKGWFITKDEPTADQRTVVEKFRDNNISAVSYETFRSKLIAAKDYLEVRQKVSFRFRQRPRDWFHP